MSNCKGSGQHRMEKRDKGQGRKPVVETRLVPLKPSSTVSLYDEEKKTVFKAGQQTVEVNVRIKKTPTPSTKKPTASLASLRRGSWADILSHPNPDEEQEKGRSPRRNHIESPTDSDQADNRKAHRVVHELSARELAKERKAEADQLRAQLIRREEQRIAEAERYRAEHARGEGQRSAETEQLRAQLSRLQMENDVMRRDLRAAEEVGRTNEELAKDYAKTINELYQLCTQLKEELAQLKAQGSHEAEERQGHPGQNTGAGDMEQPATTPSPTPASAHLLQFQSGLREVKAAIETQMEELGRRISTPLPDNEVERELTELEADARRMLTRKYHDVRNSSSDNSFEGLDHSSTQYLNLPGRSRTHDWGL